MTRSMVMPICVLLNGCGVGVPITLVIDDLAMEVSVDEQIEALEEDLRGELAAGVAISQLPIVWPEAFPSLCLDVLFTTDPDVDGGRLDLSPDPELDPEGAERFKELESGKVTRLDLIQLLLRVEVNELNFPLPPIEILAADSAEAPIGDEAQWIVAGNAGGELDAGCTAPAVPPSANGGEVRDIEVAMARGASSFLRNELMDPDCRVKDLLTCRELSIAARSRFRIELEPGRPLPRGRVRLRPIIVATFFVDVF